jgi:hypothetical protein
MVVSIWLPLERVYADGRFLISDAPKSRKRETEETVEAPAKKKGKSEYQEHSHIHSH